jgi:threonine aldolase
MSHRYSFYNDYSEGAHPAILETLARTNLIQEAGYGNDSLTKEATELIKQKIGNPSADVHFVSGGTQANLIVLSSLLKPYESVIAAESAHINIHEAGAIEATGHKIHSLPTKNGKITTEGIEEIVGGHTDEHMVKPRVVFLSHTTEVGTIYTKHELEQISACCKKNQLYLYLDGARLGSALAATGADLTLPGLASLVDVFYIGGTKNGALIGEAIVINNSELQANFRHQLKQRGALLAKGRLLAVQFLELFKNDLFFQLARHTNLMAEKLTSGIKEQGHDFLTDSSTNQIFPILPNDLITKLQEHYGFYVWKKVDATHSAIRLVTSWTTPETAIDEFLETLKTLSV